MRNTCVSKEAVTNDCKASGIGVGGEGVWNEPWTGKFLAMGPVPILIVTTWPGIKSFSESH